MDIPRGSRSPGLPKIFVQESNPRDHYRSLSRSNSYNSAASPTSIPMSIPNSREPVPPPLPPPRHLADIASGGNNGPDIAWKWGNRQEDSQNWGGSMSSVAPGSSLYGGSFSSRKGSTMEERPMDFRRQDSTATIKQSGGLHARDNSYSRDEGYASMSGTSMGSNFSKYQESSTSGRSFNSSVHDGYRSNNAQAYDKSLLQKLDSRRGSDNKTPPRGGYSLSGFSSSATESSPTARMAFDQRHPTQLKPLSLPIITGRQPFGESPVSRWTDSPLSSANSPKNPFPKFCGSGNYDYKSSPDFMDYEKSPLSYSRRSDGGSTMSGADEQSSATSRSRGSFDARVSPDTDGDFQMEETGLRRLQIDDYARGSDHARSSDSYSSSIGQKRRASSPPGEKIHGLHTVGSVGDLSRRRESAARASPAPPFHSTSGSMSSTGSAPRNNSYAPTMSLSTSSIASSYSRHSPGGLSPNRDMSDSPYMASTPLTSSPGGSISRQLGHQRVSSDVRPLITARKLSDNGHPKSSGAPRLQGVFMCECCPKKPKKFESQEDLNAHEQEKQYECAYCRNRFKNKNEAERHQNSLHLRRHSWSCAALSGYEAVFHTSPNRPDADTCGYCGDDFSRSGFSSPSPNSGQQVSIPTDQDWEARIVHLQEMHKFGECNHAKKFFRADHFRQHLKHSHAGTSGRWTNVLENSCMAPEPLPEPRSDRTSPNDGRVGIIDEEDEIL